MYIYLPYESFKESAKSLETKELKNQIRNLVMIYELNAQSLGYGKSLSEFNSIKFPSNPSKASTMWRNYDHHLSLCVLSMIDELLERDPIVKKRYEDVRERFFQKMLRSESLVPFWETDISTKTRYMLSSQWQLIQKNTKYREKFPIIAEEYNPHIYGMIFYPELSEPSSSPKSSRHFW